MTNRREYSTWLLVVLIGATSCGEATQPPLPYATEVVSFSPGEGAGSGQDAMPDIVLGPPAGRGTTVGSLDVVSLGVGGEIVVGFGDQVIVDGEGADLVVFENPFTIATSGALYAEPGEVAVSEDGEIWHRFECQPTPTGADTYPGCAGWRPVMPYDADAVVPIDPVITGGDPFDLADVGLARARFVRIRDVSAHPAAFPPSKGFDLDAVGIIHLE